MNFADKLISHVQNYATRALDVASDRWGKTSTPLFVDGINRQTLEPVTWVYHGKKRNPSNFASQQHLMRVLVGLSELTGDSRGRDRANTTATYVLRNLQHESGLLYWGGHVAWDLIHSESMGHAYERYHHELKTVYPFYDLMWQADAGATERFIEAMWKAHVQDWQCLDLSRHGAYNAGLKDAPGWDQPFEPKEKFFVGKGLSFANAGSDLFYAAAMLHHFTGDERPLTWAKRLAQLYQDTADPKTGLVGYQYSQVEVDRAQKQLGPEFGPRALEGTTITRGRVETRYAVVGLIQFYIASRLGEKGACFRKWAHESLTALANHAYDFENNLILPGLTDGTRIGPDDLKREGYYSRYSFTPWSPGPIVFRAYANAYRHTQDPLMLKIAARIARDLHLGDITAKLAPTDDIADVPADVNLIHAMLDLWQATDEPHHLAMANTIAQRIIDQRFRDGLFVSGEAVNVRIDSRDALALLHVAAAHKGKAALSMLPPDHAGRVDFTCEHDGYPNSRHNRVSDNTVLYAAASVDD